MKKKNKLTKVLGASVMATSLLFPTTAQAAIDASNITVDPGMESDIVAKINKIRLDNGLPAVIYSPELSEQSKYLLAGAESVNSRFTNGAGSAHNYYGQYNYNTNEVWSSEGVSSDFAAMQWLTEIYNVTKNYPIGHCKALLSATSIGGALATENGQTLYVSSYVDGSADMVAIAESVCYNEKIHKNIEGYYKMLSDKSATSTTPSVEKQQVSVEEVTSVVKPAPVSQEVATTVEKPQVSVEEVTSIAKPAPVSQEVATTVEKPQVSVEEVTSVAKPAPVSQEVATTVEKPQVSVEEVTSATKPAPVSQEVATTVEKPQVSMEETTSTKATTSQQNDTAKLVNDLTKQKIANNVAYINEVINVLKTSAQSKELTELVDQIEKAKNDALNMKDDTKVLEGLENIILAFEKLANEEETSEAVSTTSTEVKSEKAQVTTDAVKHNTTKASIEKTVNKVAKNPNKKMSLPKTGVTGETSYAQLGLLGLLLATLGFGLRRKAK